jgi:hypothetical protein
MDDQLRNRNNRLRLELFNGAKGISKIYEPWLELSRRCRASHLMQLPDYYLSYAELLASSSKAIFIAAFYDNLELCAILPLRFDKTARLGVTFGLLEFPNTPIPIKGFVAQDHLDFHTLVACLANQFAAVYGEQWDILRLTGITGPVSEFVAAGKKTNMITATVAKNNYIQLFNGDYVHQKLGTKMRSNLRRRMKKLVKAGRYEFKTISKLPELYDAYDAFVETEAAGWKSRRGGKRAIKLHADQRAFYSDLLLRHSKDGRCHIHLLELDGRAIASDFCLMAGNSAFSLKHGFDEVYSDVSPSQLLREYTIKYYSGKEGIQIIDLVSGYAWHDQWRPDSREVLSVVTFNRTVRGVVLQALLKIKELRAR